MKVLFLCRRPFETIVGGVAEYLHYLPLALKDLNIQSISYTESNTSSVTGPYYLANGMPAFSGPYLKPGLFSFSRKLKPLFEFCQQQKIDVVHAQGIYRSGYVAAKIFENTGIPFIVTSHSDILATNSERIQRSNVLRRCRHILKQARAVTHLTPHMAEACHRVLDTRDKDFIIGNGITVSEWENVIHLPEKDYMLAIGRLEVGKGFNILIDAYAKLRKQGIHTALIIAGDGSERAALQHQVAELKLDNVIFTGYIRGDEKKRLFAESKLVLFGTQPETWEEAFSIVQMETIAAGKAMIASDTLPTRYLQSIGLQAQLVPSSNTDAWANAMEYLLTHDEERQRLGQRNLHNAKQFDWHVIAKQYAHVYEVCKPKST